MLQILMPYLLIEQPHVLQLLVNLDIYIYVAVPMGHLPTALTFFR